MGEVKINYSEYGKTSVAKEISFELIEDILLKLEYNKKEKNVTISMLDTIADNTQLEGKLDYENLNLLIRVLSQLRNQLKSNS